MAKLQGFFSDPQMSAQLPRVAREVASSKSPLARARRDLAYAVSSERGDSGPDYLEADAFLFSLGLDDPRKVTSALRSEAEKIRRRSSRIGTFGTEEAQDAVLLGAESGRTALDTQLEVQRELEQAQSRAQMGNEEILNAYSDIFGVKL